MFTKTKAVFFAGEEEDLICCFSFFLPPDLYFKCQVFLSWMLNYCLKGYAPKEERKKSAFTFVVPEHRGRKKLQRGCTWEVCTGGTSLCADSLQGNK